MLVNGPTPGVEATKPKPAAGADAKQDAKLKAACTDMEAVFINMLLTEMRKSVPKGGLIPTSNQEEIMRSLLDSELSKNMAHAGGTGLAEMLYRQLSPKETVSNSKSQAPR
ncbi:MAG TPA: rod-binding protein [Negativicutes bacterium]|nr:rod-binding protein [Negativicutes bacterium]